MKARDLTASPMFWPCDDCGGQSSDDVKYECSTRAQFAAAVISGGDQRHFMRIYATDPCPGVRAIYAANPEVLIVDVSELLEDDSMEVRREVWKRTRDVLSEALIGHLEVEFDDYDRRKRSA